MVVITAPTESEPAMTLVKVQFDTILYILSVYSLNSSSPVLKVVNLPRR